MIEKNLDFSTKRCVLKWLMDAVELFKENGLHSSKAYEYGV